MSAEPDLRADPKAGLDAAELQDHLRNWAAAQTLPSTEVPPSRRNSPLADLQRIAALWHRSATRLGTAPAGIPGPQSLADAADAAGIDVEISTARIDRLGVEHIPCSVLMADGTSRLVVAAPDRKTYTLLDEHGTRSIARKTLKAEATGTVFVFRDRMPHDDTRLDDPATAGNAAESGQVHSAKTLSLNGLLLATLAHRKAQIASLVAAGLVSNCVSLAMPLFTMTVFDRVVPHSAFETLWALAIGIFLLLLTDLAIRQAKLKIADAIGLAAGTELTARVYSRLLRAPLKLVPRTAGSAVQPFAELNGAAQLAPQFLAALMSDIPFFGIVTGLLAMLGGVVAVVPLAAMLALFCLQALTHRMSMRATGEEARLTQRQTQSIIDTVASIETLKASTAETQLLDQWERRADAAAYAGHKLRVAHAVIAHVSAFVSQAVVVATVVIGVYQVSAAAMSLGALSASMLLVGRVVPPISGLFGQYFRLLQIHETTAQLVALASAEPEAARDARAPQSAAIAGTIELRKVNFSYPGHPNAALTDVSLTIAPGERVGIVGRAGCGKSSLLRLLVRLYEPGSGDIVLDGRDIRQFDPREIRRAVALMAQDTTLIDGTLHENLTLGLGDVPSAHFDFVTAMSGVKETASRHPSGYSLPVGPGGRRLSGGERQSVALARALMGQPKLLLLDEPTASMDNEREAKVIAALGRLSPAVGFVIATHRLPALALVSRIILIENGRILADGPKAEVFRQLGVKAA